MGCEIGKQSEMIAALLERMAYLEAFLTGKSEALCETKENVKVEGLVDVLRENTQKLDECYKTFDRLQKIIKGE